MDIDKLENLLNGYEGPKLDFKEEFNLEEDHNKKEFAKDICAIANSRGGRGYIIFGVKDKTKEIIGVPESKLEEERIQQIATSRTEPPVQIRAENVPYKGKNLLVVTIFKSDSRPHQINHTGGFLIRRGSTTDIARRDEIASMMQECGTLSFETIMMGQLQMNMLNWDLIDKYLEKFKDISSDNKYILVEALGIIKKDSKSENYHPTMGGMLIFGKNVQTFLPNTGVKIYSENTATHISGTINEMLDEANDVCRNILGNKEKLLKAIDLSLSNALAHRDYWDNSRLTVIKIFDNRVEISNPGAFYQAEQIDKIKEQDISVKRNPWLYERLLMLDDKSRYLRKGTGLTSIKELFDNDAEVKFINITKYNIFKVILPR